MLLGNGCAARFIFRSVGVVVNDFANRFKFDFNYFAIGALDFNARLRQRLRHLHAEDTPAHAVAVFGDDLDVILVVKRLERSKSFGDFH